MKHLKRYNEGFITDLFYSGNKIIKKYIDLIENNPSVKIKKLINKTFVINGEITVSDTSEMFDKKRYSATIDGKNISASRDLIGSLCRKTSNRYRQQRARGRDINDRYNYFVGLLINYFRHRDINLSPDEMRDRLEEFGVVRDDFKKTGDIDMLSLKSLFDFYELEFTQIAQDDLKQSNTFGLLNSENKLNFKYYE